VLRTEGARDLNAFLDFDADAVRAAARLADVARKRGAPLGPLFGIPLAIKDNIDTATLRTTAGTLALAEHRPAKDAPVVTALREAGALVFGKTNMHELAFGITSNNAAFGAVKNPFDTSRIPGGSSGGTAVAVAARLAPAGIGTCTGGSLRIPASLCGIVGFRPTVGRWPGGGIVPISRTRDTPGPMTRSVADCALLDAVVTGLPVRRTALQLRGSRLGLPRAQFWDLVESGVAPVLEDALSRLRATGVVLVECDVPDVVTLAHKAGAPINFYEIVRDLSAYLAEHELELDFEGVVGSVASPDVAAILRPLTVASGRVSEETYRVALQRDRPALQDAYRACFADYDIAALLFPTTPLAAAKIGDDESTLLDGAPVSTFRTYVKNTHPGSLAGLPGISLPAGATSNGLPVGIALDALPGSDHALLEIASLLEGCLAPNRDRALS
jgi:mandelamide amidase